MRLPPPSSLPFSHVQAGPRRVSDFHKVGIRNDRQASSCLFCFSKLKLCFSSSRTDQTTPNPIREMVNYVDEFTEIMLSSLIYRRRSGSISVTTWPTCHIDAAAMNSSRALPTGSCACTFASRPVSAVKYRDTQNTRQPTWPVFLPSPLLSPSILSLPTCFHVSDATAGLQLRFRYSFLKNKSIFDKVRLQFASVSIRCASFSQKTTSRGMKVYICFCNKSAFR